MKNIPITDAEWDVMECVWKAGRCPAADVIAALRESRNWNHRTVRSLLARLVEKQALTFEVDGPRYVYAAAIPRECCVASEGRSFVDKFFGGDVAALIAHFAGDATLDDAELNQLRKLLDKNRSHKRGPK
jgi:BlaI family penicillinase repressor